MYDAPEEDERRKNSATAWLGAVALVLLMVGLVMLAQWLPVVL